MICPILACFVFLSRFLYFSSIAVVPSLSALLVPMCTSMDPPFPLPMICSTHSPSVACSILAPGRQTTTSRALLNRESVFLTMECPTQIVDFLLMPSISAAECFFLHLFPSPSNVGSISPLFVSNFPGCRFPLHGESHL